MREIINKKPQEIHRKTVREVGKQGEDSAVETKGRPYFKNTTVWCISRYIRDIE